MIPDHQNNARKCDSLNRVFVLLGSDAQKDKCMGACEVDSNCVYFSGIWNDWCIGCNIELQADQINAIAFRKIVGINSKSYLICPTKETLFHIPLGGPLS